MISLDDRIGSKELRNLFRPFGIAVELKRMESGDIAFEGWGPKGRCAIGIERKRIDDLVQSMETGRLSGHQLGKMAQTYDYGYLVVEGIWKAGENGELMVFGGRDRWFPRKVSVRGINNYLMGLSLRAGLICWRTSTDRETVEFTVDQYRMWNEKRWEEHKSHETIYTGADNGEGFELNSRAGLGRNLFHIPRVVGEVELFAKIIPGVGDRLAHRVGKKFGTIGAAVNSDESRWAEVKGISKEGAKKIRNWMWGVK